MEKEKSPMILVDSSVLVKMIEGDTKGKAKELLDLFWKVKSSGGVINVQTTLNSLLNAIFKANPNTKINNLQNIIVNLNILMSIPDLDFKDDKQVMNELILVAKISSGDINPVEALRELRKIKGEE